MTPVGAGVICAAPFERTDGLAVRVAVAVVPVVAPGAASRRGAPARQHIAGAAKGSGRRAERAADYRADGTRRPIAARGPGGLALYRAEYRVGIAERPGRLTD